MTISLQNITKQKTSFFNITVINVHGMCGLNLQDQNEESLAQIINIIY